MKVYRKIIVAIFALTILMFLGSASLMSIVHARFTQPVDADSQTIPLEGDMNFKVYPDHSIEVNVSGSLEQVSANNEPPPVYGVLYDMTFSPSDMNLTEIEGSCVIKMSPTYSVLLSALDLDITAHSENMMGNMTVLFNLPGYLGVNGTIEGLTDKVTRESTLDFDLTTTIWYSVVPEDDIQELIQNFTMFESQLASQVNQITGGNLTLRGLTLVNSKLGTTSATLTLSGSVVGDFYKGLLALSNKIVTPDIGAPAPKITTDELWNTTIKSSDFHLTFDNEGLAFKIDVESIIKGDIDQQINIVKNLILEGYLQSPQITPEMVLIINNVLLPTEISIVNLNAVFKYAFDGENLEFNFLIDGLSIKPLTTQVFLTILDQALTGVSMPGVTLTLEGASDEKEFVEIEVPQATSEPVSKNPRKAVWTVDNLVNLKLVIFQVKKWPTLTLTSSQTEFVKGDTVKMDGVVTIEGEPVIGHAVNIVANNAVIGTVETDQVGKFSFTYKFENAGNYEVKSSLEYYEKAMESQITTITIKPPPILPPELVVPVVGGIIIAAVAVGYILMKRR